MNKNEIVKSCPYCGGDIQYYHDLRIAKIICKKRCKGFHVIQEIDIKSGNVCEIVEQRCI